MKTLVSWKQRKGLEEKCYLGPKQHLSACHYLGPIWGEREMEGGGSIDGAENEHYLTFVSVAIFGRCYSEGRAVFTSPDSLVNAIHPAGCVQHMIFGKCWCVTYVHFCVFMANTTNHSWSPTVDQHAPKTSHSHLEIGLTGIKLHKVLKYLKCLQYLQLLYTAQ